MLIDSGFCITLYTTFSQDLVRPIVAAQYNPKEYHFFNTQVPHAVFNFDKPRYLFTLEFVKDKNEFGHKDLIEILKGMDDYEFKETDTKTKEE